MIVSSFLLDLCINTVAISSIAIVLFLCERFLSWKVLYYIWVVFVVKSLLIVRYSLLNFITSDSIKAANLSAKAKIIAFNSEKYIINSLSNVYEYYFNVFVYSMFFIWLAGCIGFLLFSIIRYKVYINNFKSEPIIVDTLPLEILETAKCEMRIKSKVKMIYSNNLSALWLPEYLDIKLLFPKVFLKPFHLKNV